MVEGGGYFFSLKVMNGELSTIAACISMEKAALVKPSLQGSFPLYS